jgi:hypothetical protein
VVDSVRRDYDTTAALKRVLLPAAFAENASGKQLASHVANFG